MRVSVNKRKGVPAEKEKNDYIVEERLTEMYSPQWLRSTARKTGLVKRERKIDPVYLFWTFALSISMHTQRTLASLKRGYEERAGIGIAMSSFYERFSPELVRFLHECVLHGMEQLSSLPGKKLKEALSFLKDIVVQDSSVIRLNAKLAEMWPATRSRRIAAGIRVSAIISMTGGGPKSVRIFGERQAEIKTVRIGKWVKDRLFIADPGFFKYSLFERIEANGGYFLSRLKSNADVLILSVNAGSGLPEGVPGRHLSELLPEMHHGMLDAVVEVSFRKRQYRGSRSAAAARFRLVCVWDDVRREYHSYITNLPVGRLNAAEVATLYRCRWEIELVFKELKSQYRLDQMPTANPHAVEALVWTALITMLVSRRLYLIVVDGKGIDAIRYTRLRWSKIFVERGTRLFDFLLDYMDIEDGFDKALAFYESPALDPNVRRRRLMGDELAFP